MNDVPPRGAPSGRLAVWLVLLAAAGTFALTMGTRQSMGLFLGSLNTSTGLGLGQISLAFAFGQLCWGVTQPFAGAIADRVGAGRVLLFAAVMGLTFLSTVPPTVGLVAKFFGTGSMATLVGVVMLTHQLGAFLGAWLGGRVFEATGNFDWVWYIDILLAVGATLIHLPIREARLAVRQPA